MQDAECWFVNDELSPWRIDLGCIMILWANVTWAVQLCAALETNCTVLHICQALYSKQSANIFNQSFVSWDAKLWPDCVSVMLYQLSYIGSLLRLLEVRLEKPYTTVLTNNKRSLDGCSLWYHAESRIFEAPRMYGWLNKWLFTHESLWQGPSPALDSFWCALHWFICQKSFQNLFKPLRPLRSWSSLRWHDRHRHLTIYHPVTVIPLETFRLIHQKSSL